MHRSCVELCRSLWVASGRSKRIAIYGGTERARIDRALNFVARCAEWQACFGPSLNTQYDSTSMSPRGDMPGSNG